MTRIDMLNRLSQIVERRIQIAAELAPFYQAARVLSTNEDGMPDYEMLENHPNFRPTWQEDVALRDEFLQLLTDLS